MKQEEIFAIIKSLALFNRLNDRVITKLSTIASFEIVPRDQAVFYENESVDAIYVIISGEAAVLRAVDSEKNEHKSLGIITAGELFGEMALFDNQPRSASVIARTELHLLKINISDFLKFLKEDAESAAEVLFQLLGVLSGELRESAREQVALYETGKIIALCVGVDELVEKIFSTILHAIPVADCGLVAIYNKYTDAIEISASNGISPEELQDINFSMDDPMVENLTKTGRIYEGNPSAGKSFREKWFSSAKTVISCPIFYGDAFLGFVALFDYENEQAFTMAQKNLLDGICRQFAPALESAAFHQEDVNRKRLKRVRI